jgi:SnoaL-like domain
VLKESEAELADPPHAHDLIRRSYEAFNNREIDDALSAMHPDVDWPNAIDGGRVHGHAALREYWLGQFEQIDPRVEPVSLSEDQGGRIVVGVHQVVRDLRGNVLVDEGLRHVYSMRDALVTRMDIER